MFAAADEIFQIAFFAILVLGWILKAVAEQKQKKQRREAPPEPEGDASSDAEQPAPEGTGQRPTHPPPVPPPIPQPPRVPRGARRPVTPVPAAQPVSRLQAGTATRMLTRTVRTDSERAGGTVRSRRLARVDVLRRLAGGGTALPGRSLTRAGVLWSEILASPRALRGPHRPPVARRRG